MRWVIWEGGAHTGGGVRCCIGTYACLVEKIGKEGVGLGHITNATHEQSTPNGDLRWYKFLLFLFALGIGNWFLGYNMISGYTISGVPHGPV